MGTPQVRSAIGIETFQPPGTCIVSYVIGPIALACPKLYEQVCWRTGLWSAQRRKLSLVGNVSSTQTTSKRLLILK